jgi:DNA-binding response OmpR family regulator/predicted Ser/Thr protein kinase
LAERTCIMQARLLIVELDMRYGEWLRHHLGVRCPEATTTLLDMRDLLLQGDSLTERDCDLVILSAKFGTSPDDEKAEGLNLLRQIRARGNFPPVIAVAEDGNELTAVRALRLGALDYLPKRLLTPQRLNAAVRLALRRIERRVARRLNRLAHSGKAALSERASSGGLPVAGSALHDFIPNYRIRKPIGESEKAVVYLASSLELGRNVALKVTKAIEDGANEQQLLAREHAALGALRHPAIVEIHDYGSHAGHEFLAMEYFARGDLKARLRRGITEEDTLRYIEKIATALRVVHAAGMLHRDLKPPNVMLRENDDIVLIDFGLARQMVGGTNYTRTGVLRGSPYYMSPEQALGERLDARSDLYSLGVMYYELLTGKKPYAGRSAIEVLEQHVNAAVPRLPEELAHHEPLLSRMLAKDRSERCTDAAEVIQAIADARTSEALRSSAA